MNKRLTKISKFLSFVLRHNPQSIGIERGQEGWFNLDDLIKNASAKGKSITIDQVREVVALNEEKRFELSEDGFQIRAV